MNKWIPTPVTPYGEECLAKIKHMLANPKKPGIWWAYEVLDREANGEAVSVAAYDMARAVVDRNRIIDAEEFKS